MTKRIRIPDKRKTVAFRISGNQQVHYTTKERWNEMMIIEKMVSNLPTEYRDYAEKSLEDLVESAYGRGLDEGGQM